MKNELVSIIIPLYNSEQFVAECIRSCASQTFNNIEIIVIDDGSTDNGLKVARQIEKTDKRVRVIHKENGGVSSARNTGLKNAAGKYICFVDADDYLDEKFVDTMVGYMKVNNSDFCFSRNTMKKNTNKITNNPKIITNIEAEKLLLGQKVTVGCWNKMYKKNVLKDISFREDLFYGEGLYFINQVAHVAKNIVVCSDELYKYRKINPESATTKFSLSKMVNGEKSLLELKKIIEKDGKITSRAWSQHYCLFCINAMIGILKTSDDKIEFEKWQRKLKGHLLQAIIASGQIKTKVKICVAYFAPRLFKRMVG